MVKPFGIITGGAQGIGASIARRFLEGGFRVAIVDLGEQVESEPCSALVAEFADVSYFASDLSTSTFLDPLGVDLASWASQAGELTIGTLVNNAAVRVRGGFREETIDSWDQTLSVGLRAAFFLSRAVAPMMLPGSTIVNVGSIAGRTVADESPSYHASKAGLEHLTRYLAVNLGSRSIRVNCILPGFIVQDRHKKRFQAENNTEFRATVARCLPGGEPGDETAIAQLAWFLSTREASFVSGASIVLDGAGSVRDQFALVLGQQGNR